jgi:hypothetical protein
MAFISRAIKAGATLCCTPLNLIEAIFLIERTECVVAGFKPSETKAFRAEQSNRHLVSAEVATLWATVTGSADILPTSLSNAEIASILYNQQVAKMDAYDLALVETFLMTGISVIASDDSDLATHEGSLTVVTANRNCLDLAIADGRLCQLP